MAFSGAEDFDLLEKGFDKLTLPGKPVKPETRAVILDLLKKYIREIELFNEAYGLVKAADRNELIVRHILDSMAVLQKLNAGNPEWEAAGKIADVGSGAGLPGIPLAICMPETGFTLIERMGRRAGFLRNCAAVLGLDNVRIEETDMEKAAPAEFDIAVFRAFRPLTPDILKSLLRLVHPRGILAAWKGRFENARDEMLAAEKSVPGLKWKIEPMEVPFLDEQRNLVLIEKPAGVEG